MTKATGPASTSISAARWPPPSFDDPQGKNSSRSRPTSASRNCNPARSTSSLPATRPGACRARRITILYFPAVLPIMTAMGLRCCRSRNIDSALDLNNSKVCVQDGTTTQLNLADYFRANNMKYEEMKFAKLDEVFQRFLRCRQMRASTADVSREALCAAAQSGQAERPRHPASTLISTRKESRSLRSCASATTTG